MSITIVPNGRGNKITALMYAIELHKKTNKKIHIIFTKQYDDIFYDLDRFFFDDLPNLLFKNISYELKEVKINPDYGYHLQLMMQNDEMNDIINKYAKDNDLKIYDSKVNESQISTLESGIITFTMTKEIKNNGIEDIKLWLSDITKYKIYDQFMKKSIAPIPNILVHKIIIILHVRKYLFVQGKIVTQYTVYFGYNSTFVT